SRAAPFPPAFHRHPGNDFRMDSETRDWTPSLPSRCIRRSRTSRFQAPDPAGHGTVESGYAAGARPVEAHAVVRTVRAIRAVDLGFRNIGLATSFVGAVEHRRFLLQVFDQLGRRDRHGVAAIAEDEAPRLLQRLGRKLEDRLSVRTGLDLL